jgi:hypothetical protein
MLQNPVPSTAYLYYYVLFFPFQVSDHPSIPVWFDLHSKSSNPILSQIAKEFPLRQPNAHVIRKQLEFNYNSLENKLKEEKKLDEKEHENNIEIKEENKNDKKRSDENRKGKESKGGKKWWGLHIMGGIVKMFDVWDNPTMPIDVF